MQIRLQWETPKSWVAAAAEETVALLADHAHCELKAAASAQALLIKHCEDQPLVEALGHVAFEELEHFHRVSLLLHARGGVIGRSVSNPYAEGLRSGYSSRQGEVLLDRLIVSGLIEARSLERFTLLAAEHPDGELRELYAALLSSEASHRALFQKLCAERYPEKRVEVRIRELCELEAHVISSLDFAPRMHSGPPRTHETVDPSGLATQRA
ncbi:MAG: tRNA isopentenyl-2-thiomethyl-A-37 hydroxylase MiaE [Planctomycetota bacterium]